MSISRCSSTCKITPYLTVGLKVPTGMRTFGYGAKYVRNSVQRRNDYVCRLSRNSALGLRHWRGGRPSACRLPAGTTDPDDRSVDRLWRRSGGRAQRYLQRWSYPRGGCQFIELRQRFRRQEQNDFPCSEQWREWWLQYYRDSE